MQRTIASSSGESEYYAHSDLQPMHSESKERSMIDIMEWNATFTCVATAARQEATLLAKEWGKFNMRRCVSCSYNERYKKDL